MNNNQTLQKPVSAIGEEIGLELGNQMVNDYQTTNQMMFISTKSEETSSIRFSLSQVAPESDCTMPTTKWEKKLLFTLD